MKMNSKIISLKFLLMLTLPSVAYSESLSDNCCFNSRFANRDNQYVFLSNFNNFSQLKFNCGSARIQLSVWEMMPFPTPLILDQSFNEVNANIDESSDNLFSILFSNLKGFDLNSNPFESLKIKQVIWWRFDHGKFDFYLNEIPVVKHSCSENLVEWALIKTIKVLSLHKGTIFSSDLCPFIFKNAELYMLSLDWISSTLIDENIFTFQNVIATNLNSSIDQLHLNFYHVDLNSKILNEFVFEKLQILDLNGPTNSIQHDLFEPFDYLQMLRLRSQNVRKLFAHQNKWLESLNSKRNKYFILVIYQAFSNVSFYDYPDEDFCHFKSFPHQNHVLPILKPTFKSKCTCLELFLIQNSARYSDSIQRSILKSVSNYAFLEFYSDVIFEQNFSSCINSSFGKIIHDCNFSKRLDLCQIKEANKAVSDFVFYVYDWLELSEIIRIFFPKYINLIVSVLGMILNFGMIFVLSNKKIVLDKMYTYLLVNTYLNLFYSLILAVKSIVIHLQNDPNVFILITSSSVYLQFFNLIFVKFLTNVCRTGSNISYFCFVLERYIMISNRKGIFIEKFQRLSKKLFILFTLCSSVLINIHIFFQFEIKHSIGNTLQMSFFFLKKFSDSYKTEPMDDYKENFSSGSEYIVLNLANCIRIVFSDLTHIVAATFVDVILLGFIKKKMKTNNVLLSNAVLNMSRIQLVKRKRKSRKSRDRLTQMIILNGINFLIFRLPLALLSFYGFVFKYNRETMSHDPDLISYIVCKEKQFCAGVQEIFISFYLFSFFFQFFILYKLDTNFKSSILDVITKVSSFKQ